MTVEELIIYGKKYIHSDFAKMLLADLLNVNPLELMMILNQKVSNEIIDKYKEKEKLDEENKF